MAIYNIYSKRQKRLRGDLPDVYQYDNMPHPFRVQVVHILRDVLGWSSQSTYADSWFQNIHDSLAREYGEFRLHPNGNNAQQIVENFLLSTQEVDRVLDVIERSLNVAYETETNYRYRDVRPLVKGININPDEAIAELNVRFREHAIGYQYASGQVVRIDSEFLHQKVVKPALHLLSAPQFAGAEKEFLKAHKQLS